MRLYLTLFAFLFIRFLVAQPGTITQHLKIDQFGYPQQATKICVVNNPVAGFDYLAGDFYTPGGTLQVRRAGTNELIHSGPATTWRSGLTYYQSGDKLWWYNFSAVTTPGTYYIYDPVNNKSSYTFEIRNDIYKVPLYHAMRTFYYQRSGFAKTAPYAGVWTDGASHLGVEQDLDCRLVTNPVPSTSRQLQGGWFDAGDYNKYTNFVYEPMHDLCLAYIENPSVWTDDYNIPESGNGVPDILDEIKWELDWLLRMQEPNGTMLMKVSVTNFAAASPPSADSAFRRYGPAQASATRTGASMFAIGALAFEACGHPSMQAYADTLREASIAAWNWLIANPAYSSYNNLGFSSANPEMDHYTQGAVQTGAAILLYALTGQSSYRTYVDNNYQNIHCLQWTFWYPWESVHQDLLLYYSVLPGATTSVKNAIRNNFSNAITNNGHLKRAMDGDSCGYRAYLQNNDNVWGSNRPRGHNATMLYNMLTYNFSTDTALYGTDGCLGYLNFLHGVNPISTVMLSNMNDYGTEKSANEFYHSWFGDGTIYDNAETSPIGPAPGYQPGGFNPHYHPDPAYGGGDIAPPENQPSLKAYKDWNTSWPENSWEITEPAIYNQASYIKLVSKFIKPTCIKTVTNVYDIGNGTLRQAVACAQSGDTIRLDVPIGDTITLSSGPLLINKNLTFLNSNVGQAPLECQAGSAISIAAGNTVRIKNLRLGGEGTSIVTNQGTLELEGVTFLTQGLTGPALLNIGGLANVKGIVEFKD